MKRVNKDLNPISKKVPYLISIATKDVKDRYLKATENIKDTAELKSVWLDTYPGHMHRLDYILDLDLDPSRWWIFTDTGDVSFQKPLPDFSQFEPGIIVCDEGTTHINGFWENYIEMYPMFKRLLSKKVYNCGIVAMPGYFFLEYITYFRNFRDNYLPKDIPQMLEQLIFNAFVQDHFKQSYEIEGLFAALCANYYLEIAVKDSKGQWVNEDGEVFVVVHRNGATKVL